jgi:hypothetical protein
MEAKRKKGGRKDNEKLGGERPTEREQPEHNEAWRTALRQYNGAEPKRHYPSGGHKPCGAPWLHLND